MLLYQAPSNNLLLAHTALTRLRTVSPELIAQLQNTLELSGKLKCPHLAEALCEQFQIAPAQHERFINGLKNKTAQRSTQLLDQLPVSETDLDSLCKLTELSNKEGKKRFASIVTLAQQIANVTSDSSQDSDPMMELVIQINSLQKDNLDDLKTTVLSREDKANKEKINQAKNILSIYKLNYKLFEILKNNNDSLGKLYSKIKDYSVEDLQTFSEVLKRVVNQELPDVLQALSVLDENNYKESLAKCSVLINSILNSFIVRSARRDCIRYFGSELWDKHASKAPLEVVYNLRKKAYQSSSFAAALLRFLPATKSIFTFEYNLFVSLVGSLTGTSHGSDKAFHGYRYSEGESALLGLSLPSRMRLFEKHKNAPTTNDSKLFNLAFEKIYCLLPYCRHITHLNFSSYRSTVEYFSDLCEFCVVKNYKHGKGDGIPLKEFIAHLNLQIRPKVTKTLVGDESKKYRDCLLLMRDMSLINLSDNVSDDSIITLGNSAKDNPSSRIRRGWRQLSLETVMQEIVSLIEESSAKLVAKDAAPKPSNNGYSVEQIISETKEAYLCLQKINNLCSLVREIPANQNIRIFLGRRSDYLRQFVSETIQKESVRKEVLKELQNAKNVEDLKVRIAARYSKVVQQLISNFTDLKVTSESKDKVTLEQVSTLNEILKSLNEVAEQLIPKQSSTEMPILDPKKSFSFINAPLKPKILAGSKVLSFDKFESLITALSDDSGLPKLIKTLDVLLKLPE